VTVSVGCGTCVPRQGEDSVALIEVADQALYLAKRSGRDRVCNGNTDRTGPAPPKSGEPAVSL